MEKTVEEAFDVAQKSPLDPSTLNAPHQPSKNAKYQNFVAKNWRGEYPLWVSYWIIGFLSNLLALVVVAVAGALTSRSYHPVGILAFFLLLWSFITTVSIWQFVGIWRMPAAPTQEATMRHIISQRLTVPATA